MRLRGGSSFDPADSSRGLDLHDITGLVVCLDRDGGFRGACPSTSGVTRYLGQSLSIDFECLASVVNILSFVGGAPCQQHGFRVDGNGRLHLIIQR